jgi:MFS family permease
MSRLITFSVVIGPTIVCCILLLMPLLDDDHLLDRTRISLVCPGVEDPGHIMSNTTSNEKHQPASNATPVGITSDIEDDRKKSRDDCSDVQDIEDDASRPSKEATSRTEPGDVDSDPEKADGTPMERSITTGSQMPMSKARAVALVVTLTGAAFLNTMSNQAVVIILPTIGRDLDIPAARQQWIVSAYSLTFGCFLLLWGRIADVVGKKSVFVLGSAWVCLTTLVCPFVPDEIGFDVFRGLQGLGAAANVPTAIGILGVTFPPGKAKNYAFATYSSGAPLGSVIGNILGGVVGEYASWRWVLWILAILAAMITIAGHFVIPQPKPRSQPMDLRHSVDWTGGATVTIAILVLLFALTEGNVVGWATPWIPVLIVLSFLLLAAFVMWQMYLEKKTTRRPLMKISMFKDYKISAAMFAMMTFFGAFSNYLIFATYFYQEFEGRSTIQTTLRFLPTGIVGIIAIFIVSQLLSKVKVYYILMWGMMCCAVACLLFAVPIPVGTTYWAFGFPAMCLSVLGADALFPALLLFIAQSLPKEDQALGGATINCVGQVGRAISLAICTAIQVAVQESKESTRSSAVTGEGSVGNLAYLSGLRGALWFNFGTAMAGFLVVAVMFRGTGKVGK